MKPRTILPILLLCCTFFAGAISAQEVDFDDALYIDNSGQNLGYDWSLKVVWIDPHGKKQRTSGRVLLAHNSGIMLRQVSASGRSRQLSIPARSIIKVKYRPLNQPLPDVLSGALNGAMGGGPIPIVTGNLGIDLLAGALTGALAGLISSPREPRRVVWVNRDSRIYRQRVLPELGFSSASGDSLQD